MKNMFKIAGIALVLCLISAELYMRFVAHVAHSMDRFPVPYLVTGEWTEEADRERSLEYEGYHPAGLSYYFDFKKPVHSLADWAPTAFEEFRSILEEKYPKKTVKIAVIGGSVARGQGSSSSDHYWWKTMQGNLRKEFRTDDIVVLPFTTDSFVSTQERLTLDFYAIPLKPDIVVIIDGSNDILVPIGVAGRPGDPYNQGVLFERYISTWFPLLKKISDSSALARYFMLRNMRTNEDRWITETTSDPTRHANMLDSTTSVYLDNVRSMSRRCDQERLPCFFLLQPGRDFTLYQQKLFGKTDETEMFIRALTGVGKIPHYYDMTHLFNKHVDYFVDYVHVDDRGQEVWAEAVAKMIEPAVARALKEKR